MFGAGGPGRRADARWQEGRYDEASIPELADLQLELARQAADLVAPGGVLAYSVCTLTEAETAGVTVASGRPPDPCSSSPWENHGGPTAMEASGGCCFPRT
ncbi:MAG: hypothetical protein Ct9H300mP12_04070 [Acidimicrobiales bacterium]|nr:MAG: hypothetical protein Ct9H300mP12_04070 [Acidimicrobiales bacterium]